MQPRHASRKETLTPLACRVAGAFALALGLCCGEAIAQGIYKSVGPNGRVVYTDKTVTQVEVRYAPIDAAEYGKSGAKFDSSTRWSDPAFKARRSGDAAADAALETARAAAAASAEEAARAAATVQQQKIEAARNRPASAVVTTSRAPAAATASSPGHGGEPPLPSPSAQRAIADPRMVRAFTEVMTLYHLVEQGALACATNFPSEALRYNQAFVSWRERNALLINRQHKAFGQSFTVAQIREMEENTAAANRGKLERANASNEDARGKWCAQMLTDINKGTFDPVARVELITATSAIR